MIKVIVVDDDIETLIWLKNIEWQENGIILVGEAENGLQALNLIKEYSPDVIVTDISMPLMDGLELIRQAKKIVPDIKSLILTCHEDFSYAMQAIKLEADDYLVKYTLTKEEILFCIHKIANKIHKEKLDKQTVFNYSRELSYNRYAIEESFFAELLSKCSTKQMFLERSKILEIFLPSSSYRLVCIFVDDPDEIQDSPFNEKKIFKFCVVNIIHDIFSQNKDFSSTVFCIDETEFAVIVWSEKEDLKITQYFLKVLSVIQCKIYDVLKVNVSSCISELYYDIMDLKDAYEQTKSLRRFYFYCDTGNIVYTSELKDYYEMDINTVAAKYEARVLAAMGNCDKNELLRLLNEMFMDIKQNQYEPLQVRLFLKRILVSIESFMSQFGACVEDITFKESTWKSYKNKFMKLAETYIDKIYHSRFLTRRQDIIKVLEYINNNLKEDLSCKAMASYINMDTSYFSRLFKKEVGISFSDYILKRRIEYATTLLTHSKLSIEEITKQIGIINISHFYRMYKKITGKTPKEVRESKTI